MGFRGSFCYILNSGDGFKKTTFVFTGRQFESVYDLRGSKAGVAVRNERFQLRADPHVVFLGFQEHIDDHWTSRNLNRLTTLYLS